MTNNLYFVIQVVSGHYTCFPEMVCHFMSLVPDETHAHVVTHFIFP